MGLLQDMALSSRRRCELARGERSLARCRVEALETPEPPRLQPSSFDVVAEIKLRAPSAGTLATPADAPAEVARRAREYARGGAVAISVLTEPDRFDGALEYVTAAAAVVDVPILRKDFLVDPYQVWEARRAGAGGVLLITRMLEDDVLKACLDTAAEAGLFVLLESFDSADQERSNVAVEGRGAEVWLGLNSRDLVSLAVDPDRFSTLRGGFDPGRVAVAESGLESPEDAGRVAALGYRAVLIGSALMRHPDPATAVAAFKAAGEAACPSR